MKKIFILGILVIVFGFVNITTATVLTFDDLNDGNSNYIGIVPPDYHDFNLTTIPDNGRNKMKWMDSVNKSGYIMDAISGDTTIYNSYGGSLCITSTIDTDFTFDGVYSRIWLTQSPRPISLIGYKDDTIIWMDNSSLTQEWNYYSGAGETKFDKVVLNFGNYFLIDDLALTHETASVPEPATMLLLGTGLVLLGRKKRLIK